MMCLREFDLKEMYISEKNYVLERLAMLVFLRNEPEFKFQDIYLDGEIVPLTFEIGLTQQNKSTYNIDEIMYSLDRTINRTVKLFAKDRENTFAEVIIELIKSTWITFHIGSKTYTMHWSDIPDIYLIFKEFNYYKQSLSVIYEKLEGVLN